jgi:hypothetical protein
MPVKNSKSVKRQSKPVSASQRGAQIMFAVFAVLIILSMVLSATINY